MCRGRKLSSWFCGAMLAVVMAAEAPASAQTSCSQQTRAAVLAQFSDSAPNASILPLNVRNGWCSVQFVLDAGGTPAAGAVASSPFVYSPIIAGTLQVNQGEVEVSRDGGVNYFLVSLTGGSVPLLFGDSARITWFSTIVPTAEFFPAAGP